MAWNEPGGRDNGPWKQGSGGGGQGPPDLEEALRKIRNAIGGIFGGGSRGGSSPFSFMVLAGILAVVAVIYTAAGFYQLDQQERGVVMRFGAIQDELQMPGLRWNWPLIDDVYKVNVTRVGNSSSQSLMLTEDENIVDIKLSVQYVIADPAKFVIEVRDPRLSLEHAAESALRHVVGSSSMDEVLTEGREQVGLEVGRRLQTYLDNYGTGIRVVKVNIDNSQPPRQVAAAFDDVQKAQEDNQRLINEANAYKESILPGARGEAQKQIEQASAYRDQVIARAQGEAERFTKILKEYQRATEVTRARLYIDAMEKVLSRSTKILLDTEGGNNLLYLPLDRLLQSAPSQGGIRIDIDPETARQLGESALPSGVRDLIRRDGRGNDRTSDRQGGR